MAAINLEVNGKKETVNVDPTTRLLWRYVIILILLERSSRYYRQKCLIVDC
jgi:hypothetical protein